jgi:hypothetical protein
MAANPIGRWCACLCGASIDHLSNQARYTPECRKALDKLKERERYRAKKPTVSRPCINEGCAGLVLNVRKDSVRCKPCQIIHERSKKNRLDQNGKRKRTVAHSHPGPKSPNDPAYVPTIHCKECYGLPHRRPHKWRCATCRQEWAPEQRPEQPILRSSAGTASDAGKFYGYAAWLNGDKNLSSHKMPADMRKAGGFCNWKRIKKESK